jgi:uncharacterized protein with NRDE domain
MDFFRGFSLVLFNRAGLFLVSNRGSRRTVELGPGVYGISNHLLDTPWPKVEKGKQKLAAALEAAGTLELIDSVMAMLGDRAVPLDHELPATGLPLEMERVMAPCFVVSPTYGTCSSSVVLVDRQARVTLVEQRFKAGQKQAESAWFSFRGDLG